MKPAILFATLLLLATPALATPALAKDKPGQGHKNDDPKGQMLGHEAGHEAGQGNHQGGKGKGGASGADKGNKGGASDCAAAANNANLTGAQRADYMKNCVPKK